MQWYIPVMFYSVIENICQQYIGAANIVEFLE